MDTSAGGIEEMMWTRIRNWSAMRWLRLAIALAFLFAAIDGNEPLAYAVAIFFGWQALFNVSCCGAACASSESEDPKIPDTHEVTYEEIK